MHHGKLEVERQLTLHLATLVWAGMGEEQADEYVMTGYLQVNDEEEPMAPYDRTAIEAMIPLMGHKEG